MRPASAADAKSKKPAAQQAAEGDSLDEALLEGLTNELAEDPKQPRQRKTGPGRQAQKPNKDGQPPSDLERQLDDALTQDLGGEDIGAPSEDENPLTSIGRRMRAAQEQIAKRDASEPTRKLQDGIVADLAKLIEAVKSQQPKPSGSSSASAGSTRSKINAPPQKLAGEGKTSNQPARDASEKLRPDEIKPVDMAEMKSLLKDLWGELPDRAREQMLQSSVDKFLPKYEVLIEKYFRRLAEEENDSPKK
jgi:hypothetical protein